MGKRGPAPKPTALRKLQGNPGKRPYTKGEPQPMKGSRTPNAPDWLNDRAKDIWRRSARTFWELGLLTEIDVAAFGAWCTWLALFVLANEKMEEEGLTQMAESGWKAQHPYVSIASNAWSHVERIGARFGMTPSDRSKLRIEEAEYELSLADQLFALAEGKGE